jgi:beta-mannosidase
MVLAMKENLSLCGDWTLAEAAGRRDIPARVPGSVLGDLLTAGLIEDPFWRENEYKTLRMMDRDYAYERTFDVPAAFLTHRQIDLVFYGLDTLAEVTVNGQTVLRADNMHRTWRVDVNPLLRERGNTLTVLLRSPNRFIEEAAQANPDVTYDGSGSVHGTSFLRKAHYMFGWDWGPQLPDAGIWRPCGLEGYDGLRIDAVEILQRHEAGHVTLTVSAQTHGDLPAALRVTLTDPDGAQTTYGSGSGALEITIDHPRLWQPNGWGEHPLYTLAVACLNGKGEVEDETTRRIGLRTLVLSRDRDEYGEEFCLKVNGHKLFSMGADYIPEDNLIGRTSPERTRELLTACAASHFNAIRVWGGGYYPEDWFLDICDELGLIVWQDLMFACNIYKMTDTFEQNIVAEVRDNLLRIRHHACIGLISGNNEMESGWCDWPAVVAHSPALKADYIKQFEYVLKKGCAALAPQIDYWPSSPSSGGCFDDPNSYDRGDVHCWDVWHGLKPFEDYRRKYPRYCSEFGFESFPNLKTVESYTLPEDRNIFSRVMESHQKCVGGNGKILYYLSQNYRYPTTFPHLLYASQLLQAEAMRAGVEHWRRYRGRCMGAIYWQLNDCWPVASWASIDSKGRWKLLQYAAARFFAPVLASCERDGFRVRLNVANDTLAPFRGTLSARLIDARGATVSEKELPVEVPALTAVWVGDESYPPQAGELHPEDDRALLMILRDSQGKVLSENCELFTSPKFFRFAPPAIRTQIVQQGSDCAVTLTAEAFAWGVWLDTQTIDCAFSDNGFFLLPGEPRAVIARGVTKSKLEQELTVTSVAELGE